MSDLSPSTDSSIARELFWGGGSDTVGLGSKRCSWLVVWDGRGVALLQIHESVLYKRVLL